MHRRSQNTLIGFLASFSASSKKTPTSNILNFENLIEGMPEWWRVQSSATEFEDQFSTGQMTDDEAVLALLVLGVDFRDERGDPLRCTKFLCRQVEGGAVGKVMGHLPDVEELGLKSWESKLQKEAQLHLARKGRS